MAIGASTAVADLQCRLDKQKFFFVGVGLFSGVTTTLFPLSVIKTRQMAANNSVAAGLSGTRHVARQIWQHEGVRGFYRGFGTVLVGTIPGRSIYMTSLEFSKSNTLKLGQQYTDIPAPVLTGIASGVGGAAGSLSTQAVVVPIDVVSQRLMVQGTALGIQQRSKNSPSSSSSSRSRGLHAAALKTSTAAGVAAAAGAPSDTLQQPAAACSSQRQQRTYSSSSSNSSRHSCRPMLLVPQPAPVRPKQSHRGLATAASGLPRMNGMQMARLIVQQEGIGGLYRGFGPSVATFVPRCGTRAVGIAAGRWLQLHCASQLAQICCSTPQCEHVFRRLRPSLACCCKPHQPHQSHKSCCKAVDPSIIC